MCCSTPPPPPFHHMSWTSHVCVAPVAQGWWGSRDEQPHTDQLGAIHDWSQHPSSITLCTTSCHSLLSQPLVITSCHNLSSHRIYGSPKPHVYCTCTALRMYCTSAESWCWCCPMNDLPRPHTRARSVRQDASDSSCVFGMVLCMMIASCSVVQCRAIWAHEHKICLFLSFPSYKQFCSWRLDIFLDPESRGSFPCLRVSEQYIPIHCYQNNTYRFIVIRTIHTDSLC